MRSVKVTENVTTKYIQNDVTMNMISGLQYLTDEYLNYFFVIENTSFYKSHVAKFVFII